MNTPIKLSLNHNSMSRCTNGRACRPCASSRERGTALIMSLVILMILTILGITAMSTASLEEKMSGNTQEGTRGFEVAESGLQTALFDSSQFAWPSAGITTTYPAINGRVAQVTTRTLQEGSPPRGSGFDTSMKAYYFEQTSNVNAQVDTANIGLNTSIVQGVVHIK